MPIPWEGKCDAGSRTWTGNNLYAGSTKSDYLAFPMSSAEDTDNMQDALTLLKGLELLGLTDKVLGRRRK